MLDIVTTYPSDRYFAFVLGGILLNLTPGQDVLFATASGIRGGPRVGLVAGIGVGLGALFHVLLSVLGLSALVAAHAMALAAIKYCGAGYLLYIAWKSWTDPGRPEPSDPARSYWSALRRGALTNILNPKPILFMLAYLPQFVDPRLGPIWLQILLLGGSFGITGTIITAGYGYLAGRAGHAIGAKLALLNRVAAVLFVGLAARLILTE